jgi:hypothetical protein
MSLWAIGFADPRLTAQARSPVDKPGKTLRVSPTLPTGRRLPTSLTALPQQGEALILNSIPGTIKTVNREPALAYSPRKPVQTPGTTALSAWRSRHGAGAT